MLNQSAKQIIEPELASNVELQIGGFIPFSCSDYPGELSAVIFCQGCMWRCRYCHNPHLQKSKATDISFGKLIDFFKSRVGLLDAVVFSGGEPICQKNILQAIKTVRQLGFKIGLHSSGSKASLLEPLLPFIDWIGLDIKALPADYSSITKTDSSAGEAFKSLRLIIQSGINYELRTTFHPLLFSEQKLLELAGFLNESGAKTFVLQIFREQGCLDTELSERGAGCSDSTVQQIEKLFPNFILRA